MVARAGSSGNSLRRHHGLPRLRRALEAPIVPTSRPSKTPEASPGILRLLMFRGLVRLCAATDCGNKLLQQVGL
eukprot:4353117-Alexandrium_andersonii.AAC.1